MTTAERSDSDDRAAVILSDLQGLYRYTRPLVNLLYRCDDPCSLHLFITAFSKVYSA